MLSLLAREGSAFDVVSGGELMRVLRAGGEAARVIFAGVGKRDDELDLAIEAGVLQINVESEGELRRLDRIAAARGVRVRAALRVNPGIDPETHRHLATGAATSKFGVPVEDARALLREAARLASVDVAGVHVHLGSMIRTTRPYLDALERLEPLLVDLGERLSTLDLGGGLAIGSGDAPGLDPAALGEALAPRLRAIGARPIFEPGRWIAAPSGVLLTRVLDRKRVGDRWIVIVDAGMNDLLRPALYDAVHPVEAVAAGDGTVEVVDVAGPVCESGDVLARGVRLPSVRPGDLLAVLDAGAYGFSMASSYNSRPRPPEVMADHGELRVVRRRESFDDLVRGEAR